MANYEVNWGAHVTNFVTEAGNPYQAAMIAMEDYAREHDEIPHAPFLVINISDWYDAEEVIGMEEILRLKMLNAEYLESVQENA